MKKKIIIECCDGCEDVYRITEPYRVSLPGERLKTLDLCDECSLPVKRLLNPKTRAPKEIRRRLLPELPVATA